MVEEQKRTDEVPKIEGIFSKDQIDTNAFYKIEEFKNTLLMDIDQLTPQERIDKLTNLFSLMETKLRKYFDDDTIKDEKYHTEYGDYSFLEAQTTISEATDLDTIRDICSIGFTCYERLMKKIGVAIPTIKKDKRKNLIAKLFSLAIPYESDFDSFYEKIYTEFKKTEVEDTMFNLFTYCIYRMPEFDLDIHNLRIGKKRSSKSTEFLQELRRWATFKYNLDFSGGDNFYGADQFLVENKYCEENIVYSDIEGLSDKIKLSRETTLCSDDAVLIGDKRQGMLKAHAVLTQWINIGADGNNNLYTLIQSIKLIDMRFINTASTILVILRRGEGMLFVAQNGYGIIDEYTGFERFQKHPNLLSNYNKAKHFFESLPSYVCTLYWNTMGDKKEWEKTGKSGNILYDSYLTNKNKWKTQSANKGSSIFTYDTLLQYAKNEVSRKQQIVF